VKRLLLNSTSAAILLLVITASSLNAETGIASEYGPGDGVAMHFCTWTLRHTQGCGSVKITSVQTGRTVFANVVDYCECVVPGSPHPYRIVDLQYGVVMALGLSTSTGLYEVDVVRLGTPIPPNTAVAP
jgi:hypothetical protein